MNVAIAMAPRASGCPMVLCVKFVFYYMYVIFSVQEVTILLNLP